MVDRMLSLKGAPNWGPLSMVRSVVINFLSKVYSKSLLKGVTFVMYLTLEVISCPEVWRPIFCKSKKGLYLVQKF